MLRNISYLRRHLRLNSSGVSFQRQVSSLSSSFQEPVYCQRIQMITTQRSLLHTSSPVKDIFVVQDDEDFKKRVVENPKPVIVEFFATWCGPCKLLMPRIERGIVPFNDKVDLAKVDIDEMPDIAMDYNVGAVPSVLVMKKGEIVDKFVGLKDDDQIDTFISGIIK